jgi:hypothetical protein
MTGMRAFSPEPWNEFADGSGPGPRDTAARLHEAWPEAEYILLPDAGHVAFEPSIARELVAATERLKRRLRAG